MKSQGFKDHEISKRLTNEGLTAYKPQSVAARYKRINRKIQERNEELLDRQLIDWEEGEVQGLQNNYVSFSLTIPQDNLLLKAYDVADSRLMRELQKLREKRFIFVADAINATLEHPRFSTKACKDRYEALLNGTARPPPELDDDPEARKAEHAIKLAEYQEHQATERKRAAEEAARASAQTATYINRQAAGQRKADRVAEVVAKRQVEKEEQAAKASLREETSRQRKQNIEEYDAEQTRLALKRKMEDKVLEALRKAQREKARDQGESAAIAHGQDRRAAIGQGYQTAVSRPPIPDYQMANAFPSTGGSQSSAMVSRHDGTPMPAANTMMVPFDGLPGVQFGQYASSDASNNDPREVMHKSELLHLITERGMSRNRDKECKEVLARRIRESDLSLPIPIIQQMLRKRNLPAQGSRPELLIRLAESDAMSSRLFRPRHLAIFNRARVAAGIFSTPARGKRNMGPSSMAPPPAKRQHLDAASIAAALPRQAISASAGADMTEEDDADSATPMVDYGQDS